MAQYILRDLPGDIWDRMKTRAAREGWPTKALILRLLDDYGANRVSPTGAPPSDVTPSPLRFSESLAQTLARCALEQLGLHHTHTFRVLHPDHSPGDWWITIVKTGEPTPRAFFPLTRGDNLYVVDLVHELDKLRTDATQTLL